ncbi:MAG: hypothetical protein ACXAC7_04080 [Candidatus Hodarchaeales archaeon]
MEIIVYQDKNEKKANFDPIGERKDGTQLYRLSFNEKEFQLRIGEYHPSLDPRPSETIRKIIPDLLNGWKFKTCVNCKEFKMSGMSSDMSGGWSGYCEVKISTGKSFENTITEVIDLCSNFTPIEFKSRPSRSKRKKTDNEFEFSNKYGFKRK